MDDLDADFCSDIIDVTQLDMGELESMPDSVLYSALRRVMREQLPGARPVSTFQSSVAAYATDAREPRTEAASAGSEEVAR
ncbi:FxSxx-COOH cyclophane-containing RiPP peptide [Actinomadura nitritigenes]|uniref:FxSxx-COOH cyclophane-containing RiPP peptide n=1 Tax=Actinomadura nitritigenes TaxID=134602 RepID=UPI003D8C86CB